MPTSNTVAPTDNQSTSNTVAAPSIPLKEDLCYFGSVNDRGVTKTFGILEDDRRRHMYILGKTGMGKTTLLTNMVLQDIYNGKGVCFIDPHGDPAEYILDRIPPYRQNDVIYFDPADTEWPIGFNMLEAKRGEEAFLIVSGMMAVFNRIWAGMWSARMEYILSNTLLALLENPGNTLLGVVRMLTDNDFRDKIISNVTDPMVRNFWLKEFAGFNDKYRSEAIAPVLNKIGQFFSTDLIRNILGQVKSTIDMRDIMDKKKILIVNLSKGRLGEDNSALLGSLLVTKIQLAAMSRVDIPEHERNDFYLYVDEFQNFTTDSFATILSEARKYRLALVLAHQYISQLTETGNEKIKNAIFGNVGTTISFRVGADDAFRMAKEFEPVFTTQQLINLDKTQIAIKLSIHGKATNPFLANTLAPIFDYNPMRGSIVRDISRERYGIEKTIIKDKINRWLSENDDAALSKSQQKRKKKNSSYLTPLNDDKQQPYQKYSKQDKNPTHNNRPPYNKNTYTPQERPEPKSVIRSDQAHNTPKTTEPDVMSPAHKLQQLKQRAASTQSQHISSSAASHTTQQSSTPNAQNVAKPAFSPQRTMPTNPRLQSTVFTGNDESSASLFDLP